MKKELRVKKGEEFQQILKTGKRNTNASFAFYYVPRKESHGRIGIAVSKKMGNAVVRNKIKRQVRMMCQSVVDFEKLPFDVILIVRFQYLEKSFEINKNNLEKLLNVATMI